MATFQLLSLKLFRIFTLLLLSKSIVEGKSFDIEQVNAEGLLNSILDNKTLYNADIRPRNNNKATIVVVNLFMRNIGTIDDINMEYRVQVTVRMEWHDLRLQFNHSQFITLPEDMRRLWTPDLFFMNEKTANVHEVMKPNVMIRVTPDTGLVLLSIRLSLTLACPMNLKYYPLDRQTCQIRMGSYSWPTKDLSFIWKDTDPIQIPMGKQLPRFTMTSHAISTCNHVTATGEYSCLNSTFTFQRELGYYMIQNFLPCGMIVMVSWISFWLGASTIDARVSLGFTTLLTMVAQIYGINQAVPPVSYTKALDVWTGACLVFIVLAIIEVSIVGYNTQLYKYRQTLPLPFTNIKGPNPNQPRPMMGGHLLKRCNKVDKVSRFLFPITFLIFNCYYWYTYQFAERASDNAH